MACFGLLYFISFWEAKLSDKAAEEFKEGNLNPSTLFKVNILSFIVTWTIVLFNKFVIPKVRISSLYNSGSALHCGHREDIQQDQVQYQLRSEAICRSLHQHSCVELYHRHRDHEEHYWIGRLHLE